MAWALGQEMNMQKDGVDHINAYSKGQTVLGRWLTNFARSPFVIDNISFASVEGWWYWREVHDDRLRLATGSTAKFLGKSLRKGYVAPPTREELKRVYYAKLNASPSMRDMLKHSTLPITHYYRVPGDTRWTWTGELWNEIRNELRKE